MKPLVLTLQAFGTFKDKVVIDFRDFEQAGLFLITGPTGSGKTTIFDGLMYALYGMMSGDDRDSTKSVKSQFASDEVECFVELQFVAQNKEYTIRRSPLQFTLGKSSRVIEQKPQVFLKTPTERLTKINEVNNKINEILNLTATQFKQIVLLPQGEFKKLLFASSLEKEIILRSVFNTQEIQRFSELLKKKSIEVSKEVSSVKTKIVTLFQSIENPSELMQQAITLDDLSGVIDLLKQSIEHYQQELTDNREKERLIKKHVSSLESEIFLKNQQKKLIEDQVNLSSQREDMLTLRKTVSDALVFEKAFDLFSVVMDLKKERDQLTSEIDDTQLKIGDFKKHIDSLSLHFEKSQEKYNGLHSVKEKLDEVKNLINKHEELSKLQSRFKKNELVIVETNDKVEQSNLQLLKLKKRQAIVLEISEKIQQLTQSRAEDVLLIEQLKNRRQQINQQLLYKAEINEITKELNKLQDTMELANQQKLEIEGKITEQEVHRQINIAASLASSLQDNQPCPVCGSLHHPKIASTIEMVEDSDSLYQQLQEVQRVIIESKTQQVSLSKQKEKLENLVVDEDVEALFISNQHQLDAMNNKLSETTSTLESLKKQGVDDTQADLESCSSKIHQLLGALKTLQQDQDHIRSDIDKVKEVTQTTTFESLVQKEKLLREQIETVEKEFISMSQQLSEKRQEFTRLETTLKGNQVQLEKVTTNYRDKQESYDTYLIDHEIVDNYQALMIDKSLINEYQQKVSQYEQQVFSVNDALLKNQQSLAMLKVSDNPEELLIEKNSELKTLNQHYAELMHVYLNHQKSCESLQDVQQSQQVLIDKFKMMSTLSDIANGSAYSGNVSFERFVLSMYFDEVLKLANLRLLEMTQSRYELVRQEENRNNRGAKGLELDVMDFYSSQMRSVKTLSGGETFKASLSLALGLSDFIKTIKGGTSIDALFVDEGFGSLDATSLDSAIEVLLKLNETGRLVGIISHVSELKQRITAQIVLSKTIDGSQVSVYV